MKRHLILSLLLIGLAVPLSARAQGGPEMVNCAGLQGLPALCFKNNSPVPIIGINAANTFSFGSDWIRIPGRICPSVGKPCIPPGGTSIIRFSNWSGCSKYLEVQTADGVPHPINGGRSVDVCSATTVNVGQPGAPPNTW